MDLLSGTTSSPSWSPLLATSALNNDTVNMTGIETLNQTRPCTIWQASHGLFQAGNALCLLSYLAPNGIYGILFLHTTLVCGFATLVGWAFAFVCSPDVVGYNLFYLVVNFYHACALLWRVRPVRLAPEVNEAYREVFKPLNVPIYEFRKLIAPGVCRMQAYQDGEHYAEQYKTRCDRLGLLISGCFVIRHDQIVLHRVGEFQFIDSSEFEQDYAGEMDRLDGSSKRSKRATERSSVSRASEMIHRNSSSESHSLEASASMRHRSESCAPGDSLYGVSIVAGMYCRAIIWDRAELLKVLQKEPFLAAVFFSLIGRDITDKLYALQSKIRFGNAATAGASQLQTLDIRLPSMANLLAAELPGPSSSSNQSQFEPVSSSRRFVEKGQFERRLGPNPSQTLAPPAPSPSSSARPSDDSLQPLMPPSIHRKLTAVTEHFETDEVEEPLDDRVRSTPLSELQSAPQNLQSNVDLDAEESADAFYTPHASMYFSQSNEALAMRLAFDDEV